MTYGSSSSSFSFTKAGSGTLEAKNFRVGTLSVNSGVLKVTDNGDNGGAATSRTANLTIASGAKFDIRDNDLVIDYTSGNSPMGTIDFNNGSSSGIAGLVKSAFASGAWTGNGLTTTLGDDNDFALGYAEAANCLDLSSGTATWYGQVVDTTTVLAKYTRYGDQNLSGNVDIRDAGVQYNNWNTAQIWEKGDFNYDGWVGVNDYSLLASNFNLGGLRGSDVNRLMPLYELTLEYPHIYFEVRENPEIWAWMEAVEAAYLAGGGTLPRAVPEPATVAAFSAMAILSTRRRKHAP